MVQADIFKSFYLHKKNSHSNSNPQSPTSKMISNMNNNNNHNSNNHNSSDNNSNAIEIEKGNSDKDLIDYNHEMMENVRSAFLECVRSYYWSRVQKGILDRYSYVTRTLIASVDLGLESVHIGLDDYNFIEKIIDDNNQFFEWPIIRNIYKYLRKNFGFVRKFHRQRIEIISNLLYLFISAHKSSQIKIPYYFSNKRDMVDSVEQALILQESQLLVERAADKLSELQDTLLEYKKTTETLLSILLTLENMLIECRNESVITNVDYHHFLHLIAHDRIAIEKLFRRKSKLKKLENQILLKMQNEIDSNNGKDNTNKDSSNNNNSNIQVKRTKSLLGVISKKWSMSTMKQSSDVSKNTNGPNTDSPTTTSNDINITTTATDNNNNNNNISKSKSLTDLDTSASNNNNTTTTNTNTNTTTGTPLTSIKEKDNTSLVNDLLLSSSDTDDNDNTISIHSPRLAINSNNTSATNNNDNDDNDTFNRLPINTSIKIIFEEISDNDNNKNNDNNDNKIIKLSSKSRERSIRLDNSSAFFHNPFPANLNNSNSNTNTPDLTTHENNSVIDNIISPSMAISSTDSWEPNAHNNSTADNNANNN